MSNPIENNSIILGDCLEVMRNIPDKSIDLVLTDPPYGIIKGIGLDGYSETSKAKDWDTQRPPKEYFDEMFRISKNQVIWGLQYFIDYLYPSKGILFWDKKNGANFMNDGEIAWTSFQKAVRIYRYAKIGRDNKEPIRLHPTQKPLALFKWILDKYSEEGQTILDPFAGSGTTAIACHDLKRNFICIEKEPEYHKIATKRYNEAKAQMTLF